MRQKPRVHIVRDWHADYRLVIVEDSERGKIKVATGFEWVNRAEGDMFDPQDGIGASGDLIQAIMDRAWEEGFRPSGYSDVKNETAAIREHLKDMRSIAFHKLGVKIEG